jgi:hypothetical protein
MYNWNPLISTSFMNGKTNFIADSIKQGYDRSKRGCHINVLALVFVNASLIATLTVIAYNIAIFALLSKELIEAVRP